MTTAPGVPVQITSPGRSVITFEWKETSDQGEKIMFETAFLRRTLLFSTVETSSSPTSPTSSGVTRWGPKPTKVSKL